MQRRRRVVDKGRSNERIIKSWTEEAMAEAHSTPPAESTYVGVEVRLRLHSLGLQVSQPTDAKVESCRCTRSYPSPARVAQSGVAAFIMLSTVRSTSVYVCEALLESTGV